MMMVICNEQHQSNMEIHGNSEFMEKLSNTDTDLKKCCL